jgi:hypothetical protein
MTMAKSKITRLRKESKRPDSHSCDGLSFTADRKKAGLPPGRFPRCFWNVKATGRYEEDCDRGEALAIEFLNFSASIPGSLLSSIVGDMPRPLTGVEIAFLGTIGDVAKAGHRPTIRLTQLWSGAKGKAA